MLENIRAQIANRWQQIVAELRSYGDQVLSAFLRGVRSRPQRRPASRQPLLDAPATRRRPPRLRQARFCEDNLLKRVRAFAHVDDSLRARGAITDSSLRSHPPYSALPPAEQRLARMLYFSLWRDGVGLDHYRSALMHSVDEDATRARSRGSRHLASMRLATSSHSIWSDELAHVPLQGARSIPTRRDPCGARLPAHARPVSVKAWYSESHNIDVLFVTLKKSEADYSPTTMYARLPHLPDPVPLGVPVDHLGASPTGQRYLTGSSWSCCSLDTSKRTSSAPLRTSSSVPPGT